MNASRISSILKQLMLYKHVRTTELARAIQLPQPTLHRIVTGLTPHPHNTTLHRIAEYFTVSIEQIKGFEPITWLHSPPITAGFSKLPVLSWEQVTNWPSAQETIKSNRQTATIYTDARISELGFAAIMNDASMEPTFPMQTLLIFDPARDLRNGCYVAVQLKAHKQAVFRQLLSDTQQHYLKPLSPELSHLKLTELDTHDRICGVLVQSKRDFDS